MTKKLFLIVFLFVLTACVPTIPDKKYCVADTDCVPATCCHPSDAVNRVVAPNCKMIDCSMECSHGTIDCGQGEIKCVNNECKAVIF